MKVKIIKSHPLYSYFIGDEVELSEPVTEVFIQGQYAIPIVQESHQTDNPLDEELPYRELLFENGYSSLEDIEQAGESLTEINGIGKKAVEKIIEFIQSVKA